MKLYQSLTLDIGVNLNQFLVLSSGLNLP